MLLKNEEEISFFEYTPEDHKGFVDCINDFYRGGYPYTRYLDADYLARKTADGSMIVTVAKNREGRVIGTSAAQRLKGVFEGSVLLLLRCVVTEYQGKGIASKQEYFLFDLINKRYGDALSYYADVMTHNNASQKTLTRHGYVLCGLRLMLYKSEIMVPRIEYPAGTKMSQAVYCKAISKKDVSLYAPPEHREVIESIYKNLGVSCKILDASKSDGSACEKGYYNISEKPKHFSSELYIERPAKDFDTEFLPTVREYLKKGFTCVAYINAVHREGLTVYEKLKKEGFFFTGIKPLSADGEYIIMSQTDNSDCRLDNIVLYEKQFDFINYITGGNKNEKR